MKRFEYSEEEIQLAINAARNGVSTPTICRVMGISDTTFYRWKKKYAQMVSSHDQAVAMQRFAGAR